MQKYQLDVAKVGWQDPLEDGEAGPALSLQTLNALPCSTFFVKKETTSLACEQALLFGLVKRVSQERASERPLVRAFSQGSLRLPK